MSEIHTDPRPYHLRAGAEPGPEEISGREQPCSTLSASPSLISEVAPARPPMVSGEYLKRILTAAAESQPEQTILETAGRRLGRRRRSLHDLVSSLDAGFNVPLDGLLDLCDELAGHGHDLEKIPESGLRERHKSPYLGIVSIQVLSAFVNQPPRGPIVDLVSLAYLAQTPYVQMFSNFALIDVHLDSASGAGRQCRVWLIPLCPRGAAGFLRDQLAKTLTIAPGVFRERPARVEEMAGPKVSCNDGGRRMDMGIRPSLRELSKRHGFELGVSGGRVTIAGVPAAVAEKNPRLVVDSGLYRMIADVCLRGGRIEVRRPQRLARPSDDLLLIAGHRHHLDHSLLFHGFRVSYRVSKIRQCVLFLVLKACAATWSVLGGRSISGPWPEILDIMDQARQSSAAADDSDGLVMKTAGNLSAAHGLTGREMELLARVLRGRSNREISVEMGIEENTVKCHVANILGKTGSKNRRRLIASVLGSNVDNGDNNGD